MEFHVLNHPLIEHKLTVLCDKSTPFSTFRKLVSGLVMLKAHEVTRNLSVVVAPIEMPVAPMTGKKLTSPRLIIVLVPHADLGILDGMVRLISAAGVGFLGMKRDEGHPTQQVTYANRLPKDLSGRQCSLIDPILATGGTLVAATYYPAEHGVKDVTAINIITAPEGIKYIEEHIDPSIDFRVVVCAVDERLNDECYIMSGLGDASDRLYGVID